MVPSQELHFYGKIKDKEGADGGGIPKKNQFLTMLSRLFYTFSSETVRE